MAMSEVDYGVDESQQVTDGDNYSIILTELTVTLDDTFGIFTLGFERKVEYLPS